MTEEKPIIFSGEQIRAILDGQQTQTSRVINLKKKPISDDLKLGSWKLNGRTFSYGVLYPVFLPFDGKPLHEFAKSTYGKPGDRLWVRETWATVKSYDHLKPSEIPHGGTRWPVVWYAADPGAAGLYQTGSEFVGKVRPSIFMPRWASRITLEVTAVRVELVESKWVWVIDFTVVH